MGMFDRFQPPTEEDEKEYLICDNCGEELSVGLDEVIYYKYNYYCDIDCLIDDIGEVSVIEKLGGEYV